MSAPASVSLIIGPGHHGPRLRDALLGAGLLRQVVQTSPSLRVSEWRGAGPGPKLVVTWDAAWTGALSRGVWGVWRRLPRLGLRETPRAPLFALWDLLASAALQPCDLLIGWCGVSLYALRRARARTVLEHPTGHVRSWMARARAEYRRHLGYGGHRAAGPAGYGLLPEGLCRRMEEEVACADQVMVLSRQAADTFLAAGVPAGKLVLVTPGVDAGRFHPGPRQGAQDRARDVLRVLYVGRLELLKGLAYLLEAFSRLRGLPCELWLCGRVLPEVGPLLRRHRREGLRVLGPVPPERMPAIYRQADVLVMPSLHEGLALVVLEAMATGLPVIATPESGAADVLEDGVQGLLVPARDPEALAARLEHLYHHEGRRRAMGAAGRARVLERLTWGHYHARLLQALRTG